MLPIDASLINENELLSYVFIGDDAFSLATFIWWSHTPVFLEKVLKNVYITIGCQEYVGV